MAITILKHGVRNKLTCEVCGCEFLYEEGDVEVRPMCFNETERIIHCPDCETEIEIPYRIK